MTVSSIEGLGGREDMIHAEYASGSTISEMRANISPELRRLGVARLMWVNEADWQIFQMRTIPQTPNHSKESDDE